MTHIPASIGSIVLYSLSVEDAASVNRTREDGDLASASIHGQAVSSGQTFPALVVKVLGDDQVNAQVFLDGNDSLWKAGIGYSDTPAEGSYHYPSLQGKKGK